MPDNKNLKRLILSNCFIDENAINGYKNNGKFRRIGFIWM